MNGYTRIKLLLTEDHPTVKPLDQERWAETPDATGSDLEPSFQILRGLHARWAALLRALHDDDWDRGGSHPETGEITVGSLLRTYAGHGEAHLAQLERVAAAARAQASRT
jgi:hypothetical protein